MTSSARLASALDGRYRIEQELGAGGMATVYQAHDLKHDRHVAIKVLHPDLGAALGGDRFLSEIKTTARLQHPHILPLLDSGDADGLLYYVMPLVSGETLRARLEREKQLPIDDAVGIAREVADALEYAHSLGVIHRDIKPENILLQNGHALVADFGIALAVQSAGGERMTQTGLSLGTPQYMSPEQAMGERTIDARTDIYALGAVTYEMLAGNAPFTGATVQAIVARVITERPTPLRTVRDTVAPSLEHAVLKALAKLPADRWSGAHAFAQALTALQSGSPLDTSPQGGAARHERRQQRAVLFAALAVMLISLGGGAWSWRRAATNAPSPVIPLALDVPNASPDLSRFGVSPQGTRFAFATNEGIAIRDTGQREYRVLPATVGGESPSFSPDGDWIAFQINGHLRKMPVAGGSPITVIPDDSILAGRVTWGDDGSIVFETNTHLGIVGPSGALRLLAKATNAEQPHMTFDGKGVLYVNQQHGSKVYYYDLAADSTYAALDESAEAILLPNGYLLYCAITNGLYAVRFDQRTHKTDGAPIPVVLDISPNGGVGPFVVTRGGMLVYRAGVELEYRVLIRDVKGKTDTLPLAPKVISYVTFSPDGQKLAMTVGAARGTNRHTDIYELASHSLTPFTSEGGGHAPVWSPDGSLLAFTMEGPTTDAEDIAIQPLDRSRPPRLMPRMQNDQHSSSWPNDTTLVFSSNSAPRTLGGTINTGRTSMVNPLSGAGVRTYLNAPWGEVETVVSPDGRWAAFTSFESGEPEVHVAHFPDPKLGSEAKVSVGGGRRPRWSGDGHTIYYLAPDAKSVLAAPVTPGDPFRVGTARVVLSSTKPIGIGWDVDRVTGRILVTEPVGEATARIVVMQHWLDGFAKRTSR